MERVVFLLNFSLSCILQLNVVIITLRWYGNSRMCRVDEKEKKKNLVGVRKFTYCVNMKLLQQLHKSTNHMIINFKYII